MGVCNVVCQETHLDHPESSSRSLLLNCLQQYENQNWHAQVKALLTRVVLPKPPRNNYPEMSRFSQDEVGLELNNCNRFSSMTASQKGRQLESMLSRAYLIVDEEDMPHNQSKMLLPDLASRNLFSGSLNNSVFGMVEDIEVVRKRNDKLRAYNPEILASLELFLTFCDKVAEQSSEPNAVLYQMILSFKASMIQLFKPVLSSKTSSPTPKTRDRFVQAANAFIYFLIDVVSVLYNPHNMYGRDTETSFLSEVNLHSLVVSLLFGQKDFNELTKKVYLLSMKTQLQKFKQSDFPVKERHPLPVQFSLDKDTLRHFGFQKQNTPNDKHLPSLFKQTQPSEEPYFKCVKMMSQLLEHPQPIAKLKIIHQVGLKISRQIQKFYKAQYLPHPVIDSEKFLLITQNILSRCQNQKIVADILVTSDFIHNYYAISRKGSVLTPFLIAIGES